MLDELTELIRLLEIENRKKINIAAKAKKIKYFSLLLRLFIKLFIV